MARPASAKTLRAPVAKAAAKRVKKDGAPVVFQRDAKIEARILSGAVRCFRRFGIGKTSMEDIATESKVSRTIIYRYFPTRHHLAVEVLRTEVRDHTRLLVPIFEKYRYPPIAMIEGIVCATISARKHPYTNILVSDAGADLLSRVEGGKNALVATMFEQWIPVLGSWKRDGYIRKEVDLEDVVLTITTHMHSYLGKSFADISEERMRRIVKVLIVPAIFDFERLRKAFPQESV